MTLRMLLDRFDLLLDTPESVPKLRRFILQLAVEGELTEQKAKGEPADELLERIQKKKQKILAENDSPRRKSLGDLPKDFPFEVPENWTWTRLDDVCPYIQRGKRPDYVDVEEIPVVSQKCVQWEGFKSDRVRFIDPDTLDKYQSYRFLRKGDLLWNSTGVGTVGRVNVYRGELSEYPRVVADSHVTIVRPIKEMVLPEYIYCWIASTHIQSKVETGMTSGTTKQTELNTSTVRKTLLPLPPLEEQQRIVETVDGLMDECDALEQQQERERTLQVQVGTAATEALQTADDAEALRPAWERVREHFATVTATPEGVDALRQTILQLAVQGLLTERHPDDTPANELLEEIQQEKQRLYDAGEIRKPKDSSPVENEPFKLPPGWQWSRVNDICEIRGGIQKTPDREPQDNPYPYLRVANVQRNRLVLDEIKHFELYEGDLEKWRLQYGDILVVEGNGSESEIGRCAMWREEISDCVHQNHLIRCRPINTDMARYIMLYLNSSYGIEEMKNRAVTTSGLYNLSVGKIRSIAIPIPPLNEQKCILEKAAPLRSVCNDLEDLLSDSVEHGEQLLEAALRDASVDRRHIVPTKKTA